MSHRILIVDGDDVLRQRLSFYLGQLGYDVRAEEGGEGALARALKEKFDLCLIGMELEGMSGAETWTRLRGMQPGLEAIFLASAEDGEWARDFARFSMPRERIILSTAIDLAELTRLIIGILGPPAA